VSRDAFTLILDFHGAKMSGKVMKIVSKLTKIREDYYPEYGRRYGRQNSSRKRFCFPKIKLNVER
jgi:hypothetical protein